MDWKAIVYKILGKFWVSIVKDSWLCQMLVKFFQFSVGKSIQSRINTIKEQKSYKAAVVPDYIVPQRILVDTDGTAATINFSSMASQTVSSFSWQDGRSQTRVQYKKLTAKDIPDRLKKRVSDPAQKELVKGTDYTVTEQAVQFNKSLAQLGFQKTLVTLNGQLKEVYQLWGFDYNRYNTALDSFTAILQLPWQWLFLYPGAIQAAWDIKINGISRKNVIQFLSPLCTVQPQVITYKDQLPVQHIDVVTDAGILTAANSDSIASVSDSASPECYILPLKDSTGNVSQKYIAMCKTRNADITVPYIQVPNKTNPAQFIVKNIWKSSALIILTQSSNRKDMSLAAQFIARNASKSAAVLMYDDGVRLLPGQTVNQKLVRYNQTDEIKLTITQDI